MSKGLFITGTDTGIGKTYVSLALMHMLRTAGLRVAGMKPVASGAHWVNGRLINEDAQALLLAATELLPYEWVNPFVYEEPASPHLAASKTGQSVRFEQIGESFDRLASRSDFVVVEGVGGWLVPLSQHQDLSDLARFMGLPVLMVVGIRLGAINHARMTHALIQQSGVPFLGWVANHGLTEGIASKEIEDAITTSLGCAPLLSLGDGGFEFTQDCPPNNPSGIVEILRQMAP